MRLVKYTGKINNYSSLEINQCHGSLRTMHQGYKCEFVYSNETEADVEYYKWLNRIFKKVPKVKLTLNLKLKKIKFEILEPKTTSEVTITYACYCMLRFPIVDRGGIIIQAWYDLCLKYPNKNKFKLLLWINNKHNYNKEGVTQIYYHNFFTSHSGFIYEMISFSEFIKKDIKNNVLNAQFTKINQSAYNIEQHNSELDKLLITL